jgi:hypothetical protein
MLFMHEVHTVRGWAEDEFEAASRDGWMPMLGAGDDAWLLWYTNHAHGSGPALHGRHRDRRSRRIVMGAPGTAGPKGRSSAVDA